MQYLYRVAGLDAPGRLARQEHVAAPRHCMWCDRDAMLTPGASMAHGGPEIHAPTKPAHLVRQDGF